jgi:catalase
MAFVNPKGRVNYEPNSWGGAAGGPREGPETGFTSYPAEEQGEKLRVRSETFADHYSQARQFYLSQTPIEQAHIAAAFTFELSKVEHPLSGLAWCLIFWNGRGAGKESGDGLRSMLPKAAEPARRSLPHCGRRRRQHCRNPPGSQGSRSALVAMVMPACSAVRRVRQEGAMVNWWR